MKHRGIFLFGTVLASLLISMSFGAGKAIASTGCFLDTVGHPFESYICWMKDNGITSGTGGGNYSPSANVTRGQMAVFLQRQAEIPPTSGDFYVNVSPGSWVVNGTNSGYVQHYTNGDYLRSPVIGAQLFQLSATLPSSMYSRATFVRGVYLCHDATASGASITKVELQHWQGGATPSLLSLVTDETVRTDASCNLYSLQIPTLFYASDHVNLVVAANFENTLAIVKITSVTFELIATPVPEVLALPKELRTASGISESTDGAAGTAP